MLLKKLHKYGAWIKFFRQIADKSCQPQDNQSGAEKNRQKSGLGNSPV